MANKPFIYIVERYTGTSWVKVHEGPNFPAAHSVYSNLFLVDNVSARMTAWHPNTENLITKETPS